MVHIFSATSIQRILSVFVSNFSLTKESAVPLKDYNFYTFVRKRNNAMSTQTISTSVIKIEAAYSTF